MFCWYCISCLYPAFFSASFYGLTGFLSISSFANNYELFKINNLYFNIFYLYYIYFIYVSYMFYIVLQKCSTNKEIFRNSVKPYKKESRVQNGMQYQQNKQYMTTIKNQKRDMISAIHHIMQMLSQMLNVEKLFLSVLYKYFPPHNKFHKIFNRNTLTISYSCIPNMKRTVNSHIQKIANPKTTTLEKTATTQSKIPTQPKLLYQQHYLQSSISIKQPTLQRKKLLWQS